jgi:PD-(D/E)XK nuclease superfamily
MKGDDPQADNLFSRLISYTPRISEGGECRTALEDFYTEALAWCLRNSKEFRKAFFALIQKNLVGPESKLPTDEGNSPAIHTQLNFDSESDDEEDEELSSSQRRFDLVIHSESNDDFVVVLEDKVRWKFTDGQIPAYLNALKTEVFKNFRTKILIVLSPTGQKPKLTDDVIPIVSLKWSEIQKTLADVSQLSELKNLSIAQNIWEQFAKFLKKKGLAPMHLVKINPNQSFKDGIQFAYQIQQIFLQIRDNADLKDILSSKVHLKEYENDGCLWASMSSKNKKDEPGFTLYFKVWPDQEMLIETFWVNRPSDPQKCFNKQEATDKNLLFIDWGKNGKGFGIQGKFMPESEYDGDADKIKEWFSEALDFTLKLRKGCSVH